MAASYGSRFVESYAISESWTLMQRNPARHDTQGVRGSNGRVTIAGCLDEKGYLPKPTRNKQVFRPIICF